MCNIRAWESFLLSVINERITKPEELIQSSEKGTVMTIKQTSLFCGLPTWKGKRSVYLMLSAWEGLRNHT